MKNFIQAISKQSHYLVIAAAIFFGIYFSLLSINRLDTFRSNYYDLGIMDQTVYNTSRGRILELTNPHVERNTSRLAIHFDPILAFFSPFYIFVPSPAVLLIIQAFAVGSGAIAVYFIGLHLLKHRWFSTVFALSYLFFYPNQRGVIFDFHPVLIATPLIAFAILFQLKKKYAYMFICLLLALMTKEHVGLSLLMYGLYLTSKKNTRKIGVLTALTGFAFFVFAVKLIIPHFNQGNHFAIKFFSELGNTPMEVFFSVLEKPYYIVEKLSRYDELRYLASILAPSIIFLVFAPLQSLAILPELSMNMLSTSSNMRAVYFHYNAVLTPFLFFASISGMAVILRRSPPLAKLIFGIYIVLNIFSAYWHDPLPAPYAKEPYNFHRINQVKMRAIRIWQKRLKSEDISLSTTPRIAPFFTRRKYYYNFLYDTGFEGAGISESDIIKEVGTYKKAQYLILEKEEAKAEQPLPKLFYLNLRENGDYKMIYEDYYFEVYRKSI